MHGEKFVGRIVTKICDRVINRYYAAHISYELIIP